ncbi:MAG: toprim domain-containing protein, partial [bacterium]
IILTPENVRYCPDCYESETKKKYPAMVARLQGADGQPVSIHRTYLADLPVRKKLMPGVKKLNGAAIRLMKLAGDTLGISEGIETALSAAQLYSIPVWASIGTALLESWLPPEGIRKIIIFGDSDANYSGERSAFILANKLYLKDFIVSVEIPDITGDWNDILRQ